MTTDAIDRSLARWHAMVDAHDLREVSQLLAPEVHFRSPFGYKPYVGQATVAKLLQTVVQVFQDFQYHRHFRAGDSVALEFSAKVGDLSIKGIDLIQFDDQGQILEFEVMVRPANGLMALGQEMGQRLATQGLVP